MFTRTVVGLKFNAVERGGVEKRKGWDLGHEDLSEFCLFRDIVQELMFFRDLEIFELSTRSNWQDLVYHANYTLMMGSFVLPNSQINVGERTSFMSGIKYSNVL